MTPNLLYDIVTTASTEIERLNWLIYMGQYHGAIETLREQQRQLRVLEEELMSYLNPAPAQPLVDLLNDTPQ